MLTGYLQLWIIWQARAIFTYIKVGRILTDTPEINVKLETAYLTNLKCSCYGFNLESLTNVEQNITNIYGLPLTSFRFSSTDIYC